MEFLHSELHNQTKSPSTHVVPASWATWSYPGKYLPEEFYSPLDTPDNVLKFALWVKNKSWEGSTPNCLAPYDHISTILLGLGLALWDLETVLFTEPDEIPLDVPSYAYDADAEMFSDVLNAAKELEGVVSM
jgi:hypothetical protein